MSEHPFEKDAFDEKVERLVEHGVQIPEELKADFLIIYRAKRDEIRAKIEEKLNSFRMPGSPDHEVDAISSYLSDWTRQLKRQDAFVNYQQLMVFQGRTPVDDETFRFSKPDPKSYYKRSRFGMKLDHVARRDCISERWSIFRKKNLAIGDQVKYLDNVYRIVAVDNRVRLVLEPVNDDTREVAASPHLCTRVVTE